MAKIQAHTRYLNTTIPDAVRKVLIHVPMEGGKMEHDSNDAGDLNVTRLK